MGVTIWDRLGAWGKNKLEDGFEDGASIQIKLSTEETIPGEVRVFKAVKGTDSEADLVSTKDVVSNFAIGCFSQHFATECGHEFAKDQLKLILPHYSHTLNSWFLILIVVTSISLI